MYDLIAASSVGVLHDSIIVDTTGSLDYIWI
jgi:ribonuclease PH